MKSCRGTHITITANCKCSLWIAGIFVQNSLRLRLSGKMLQSTFSQVHNVEFQSYCSQHNIHILALTLTCHLLMCFYMQSELLYFSFYVEVLSWRISCFIWTWMCTIGQLYCITEQNNYNSCFPLAVTAEDLFGLVVFCSF